MTEIRAKAIRMLEKVPDEHIAEVIDFMETLNKRQIRTTAEEKMAAYNRIVEIAKRNRREIPADYNWKDDLTEALWEKYESIN